MQIMCASSIHLDETGRYLCAISEKKNGMQSGQVIELEPGKLSARRLVGSVAGESVHFDGRGGLLAHTLVGGRLGREKMAITGCSAQGARERTRDFPGGMGQMEHFAALGERRFRAFGAAGGGLLLQVSDTDENVLAQSSLRDRGPVWTASLGEDGPLLCTPDRWLRYDSRLQNYREKKRQGEGSPVDLLPVGRFHAGTVWAGDAANILLDGDTLEERVFGPSKERGSVLADIRVAGPGWFLGRIHPSDALGLWHWDVERMQGPRLMQRLETPPRMTAYCVHPERGVLCVDSHGVVSVQPVILPRNIAMEF